MLFLNRTGDSFRSITIKLSIYVAYRVKFSKFLLDMEHIVMDDCKSWLTSKLDF